MSDELRLPDDLVAFLAEGRELDYDYSQAEPRKLILRSVDALKLGEIYSSSAEEGHPPGMNEESGGGVDPHIEDEEGYYIVPAVNLVESCTGDYTAKALLAWIPSLDMYATWDSSHFDILVFPRATWTDIAADPLQFVRAQWSNEPPGYYLAPWLHDFEYRQGWPDDSAYDADSPLGPRSTSSASADE